MSTAQPEQTTTVGSAPSRRFAQVSGSVRAAQLRLRAGTEALRAAVDRPLTSYYLLLGASALLLVIGVIMVFSASSVRALRYEDDSYALVKRQLMWVVLGLPAAWVASRLPIRWVRQLAFPAYLASVVLLVLVALYGTDVNGNKNWLSLGPIGIQPSEVAKLALVLWTAHVFANKDRVLGQLRHLLIPVAPGAVLLIGLVLWGRDLGTALVLASILVAMLWVVGAPMRIFFTAIAVLGTAAIYFATTESHRMARLTTFLDPFDDYLKTGWQPAHGLFALATGGWFGQGLGGSSQKWGGLAEAHTDFIFAVIGEELGLLGTLLVIVLFLTIAWAATRVALASDDHFVRYTCFGIVAWLLSQMIINVGMVVGLLPVIGIPLPLISYGGSALVPSLVALGLLIGFARRDPDAAAALAAKKHGRSAGLSATGRPGANT